MFACRALVPALVLAVVSTLASPLVAPARAGADVCPEPNNTFASACFLGPGTQVPGFIDTPDDVDGYRIELPSGAMVSASLSSMPADYSLRLLLADGSVKAEAVQPGVVSKSVKADGLAPGTYYLS